MQSEKAGDIHHRPTSMDSKINLQKYYKNSESLIRPHRTVEW